VGTQFAYDGSDITAEIGGGAVGANYLRSLGIDEPFIRQTSSGNEHYHTDALGSSLTLSNAQGGSATTYSYEPFGKTTATGSSSNASQYTGRENDGTGLVYMRARYYSPQPQRFLSEDPIGFFGGINFYRYALNNPLSFIDPLGLDVIVKLYPGARGFGHIGVGVNTDNTVGHYPGQAADPMTMFLGGDVQGAVRPDNKFAPVDKIRIRTSPQQDQVMQQIIDEALGNPSGRTYNLYGRNCATFVEDVLRAGGLQVPYTMLPEFLMNQIQKQHR
jgi:RHS repeat-associated protein